MTWNLKLGPEGYDELFAGKILPETARSLFRLAASRAAELLSSRKKDEYESGKEVLESVIFEINRSYVDLFADDEIRTPRQDAKLSNQLMAALLRLSSSEKENWANSELLALFACREIATAWIREYMLNEIDDHGWDSPEHREATIWETMQLALFNATSAVSYGEALREGKVDRGEQGIEQKVKEALSIRGRNAVQVKHERTNRLKEDFLRYYSERRGDFKTKRQCAEAFYESLLQKRKELLRESNAIRTLLEWERAARRSP